MKIAIYCRVSTIDQNPENQRRVLVERAEREGWEYQVFEETESTRRTRPVKEEVLSLVRKRTFDGILVWKLDRWSRSVSEAAMEFDEFVDKNIAFISHQEGIDITSSMGRFAAHIISAFAQLERSIIRERTLLGLARAKAQGKTLGRPKGKKDGRKRKPKIPPC